MAVGELLSRLNKEYCIYDSDEDNCRATPHKPQADTAVEDDSDEMPSAKEQLHANGVLQVAYVSDTVDDTFA